MAFQLSGDFNGRVIVRNAGGAIANLHGAYSRARREIKVAVGESTARLQSRTIDLCPKDTFYMSRHVRADFSKNGYTSTVGWNERDFIGSTNTDGKLITSFYPFFVEYGTRHMRAQPSLSVASREEEPRFQKALSKALSDAYKRGTSTR